MLSDEEKEALEILNSIEWDGFMITIKNLIDKQQKEIDKQNKVIDELIQELTDDEFDNPCTECYKECEKDNDTLFNCIKQYFIRKAEEDD